MGMFSGVGGFLNDITGASSAQNKQYQHSKALADRSFAQQKNLHKTKYNGMQTTLKKLVLIERYQQELVQLEMVERLVEVLQRQQRD